MMTKTSLKSPVFLMNIKAAAVDAARLCGAGPLNVGISVARNRNGKPAITAVFHKAHGLEFFDMDDNDITQLVLSVLRAYHAEKRKAAALNCDGWLMPGDIARTFYPYGKPAESLRPANQL